MFLLVLACDRLSCNQSTYILVANCSELFSKRCGRDIVSSASPKEEQRWFRFEIQRPSYLPQWLPQYQWLHLWERFVLLVCFQNTIAGKPLQVILKRS